MKQLFYFMLYLLLILNTANAKIEAQIISTTGDVQVRYGLEEEWYKALIGVVLKDIDTIFNGENARTTLKLSDNSTFNLGPNSVIDISDLRIIREKEMFLFLMSKKVDQIEPNKTKTELRVGNVSVIHGLPSLNKESSDFDEYQKDWSLKETNGAKALYEQKFYSNSIIKLHTILSRYDTLANQEIVYFYIAKGFEALNKKGQAIDAYQKLIEILSSERAQSKENARKVGQLQQAIKKLSN